MVESDLTALDAGVCSVLFLRGQYGRGHRALAVSHWGAIGHVAKG